MTLLERIPRETFHEGSIPVLETKRLALRAPRLGDAKTIAALANDRRIAENSARIPHPYKIADAESFIAGAAKAGEAAFLITLRDKTVIGAASRRARHQPGLAPGAGEVRLPVDRRRPLPHQRHQVVGADRPLPARARHLVGAQDLGSDEESVLNMKAVSPQGEAAGVRRHDLRNWWSARLRQAHDPEKWNRFSDKIMRKRKGETPWLTTSTNSSPIAKPRWRATPAMPAANRCASSSSNCSPTRTSSPNMPATTSRTA